MRIGGLATALLRARDGHEARLFERFDAPRPIGSGLMVQPTGLAGAVYHSDSLVLPFIRDPIVGPLSHLWPATAIQAAMVTGLMGGPLKPLGL